MANRERSEHPREQSERVPPSSPRSHLPQVSPAALKLARDIDYHFDCSRDAERFVYTEEVARLIDAAVRPLVEAATDDDTVVHMAHHDSCPLCKALAPWRPPDAS